MIPVSQEFEDKVRSGICKFYGKVQIDYTDPLIDQSINVEVNENNYTSYPKQVADGISKPLGKIICLDGSWHLDVRDWVLAPGESEVDRYQMGWWGTQLSQLDSTFVEPFPKLTTTFFSRPVRSLKVVGDSIRKEWPISFDIKLYNTSGTLVHTERVLHNTGTNWTKNIEPVNDIVKMELEIHQWSHHNRCAKVLEFFTSIQETYYDDDIITINLLEEREASHGSLPVGNISSNELSIKLSNTDKKFDVGNKQSPVYNLLKANRRIKPYIGIQKTSGEKEWVPLGVFWSNDWDVPEDDVYVNIIGRDRLDQLRVTTYEKSQVQINKSLYDLAIDVLQDSGLKESEYWIDEELKQFIIPYSYFASQSHREALRKISEACLGQVYCNRYGVLRIEGPSFTLERILQVKENTFLQSEFPIEIDVIEAYGISQEDYFKKNNPSRLSQVANRIEVETQPLRPTTEKEIYRSNEQIPISAGQTKEFIIYFNHVPCIDVSLNLLGTGTLIASTIYSYGAKIKVQSGATGSFTIIANGKPLQIINKEKAIAIDTESIVDNGEIKYTFPNNPLVQTLDVAELIANTLLRYYKDTQRDVIMNWICNPALELGDIIATYDYLTEKIEERGFYYITKQELDFDGALEAKLEGRRAL